MMSLIQSREFQFFTPLGYQIFGHLFYSPLPARRTIILCAPPHNGMDFFFHNPPPIGKNGFFGSVMSFYLIHLEVKILVHWTGEDLKLKEAFRA